MVSITALAVCCQLSSLAVGAETTKNATGLPTYPHDFARTTDGALRSVPSGQNCIYYTGLTPDALAVVEDWYKKALPSAQEDDVNKNSPYGGYFKLDGVRLVVGKDFVAIYRTAKSTMTYIEIVNCTDAPHL